MIGLLLFGVQLGSHGLEFFGTQRPIADFFAELGKLLLMFSASRLTSNNFARRRRVPLA
jgi:Kef-type K+ transport system membrane component KefB